MADSVYGVNDHNGKKEKHVKGRSSDRRKSPVTATPATAAGPNMGSPVTPHVDISPEDNKWKFLSCGIDTLDLAVYVSWAADYLVFMQKLNEARDKAQQADASLPFRTTTQGPCLIYPNGKPPMYRFHLQVKDFHFYIGIGQCSPTYPNVYVSINAKALWTHGPVQAIKNTTELIEELGGGIQNVKVSRCDLCADFQMTKPIHFDFLRHQGVPQNILTAPIFQSGILETYYIGSKSSVIRARIYDKAKEVMEHRKVWFKDVWHIDTLENVWRVEFQLRRPAIKAYGINRPEELFELLGGVWHDLTQNWFSLRQNDNPNTTRRTVHPWWQDVQDCAEKFGPVLDVQRDLTRSGNADAEYYRTRGANCMLGYAASVGLPDFDEALFEYSQAIAKFWQDKTGFDEAFAVKSVQLAGPDNSKGGPDE